MLLYNSHAAFCSCVKCVRVRRHLLHCDTIVLTKCLEGRALGEFSCAVETNTVDFDASQRKKFGNQIFRLGTFT